MNWRIAHATAIGTSHRQNGTRCQDECYALVETFGQEHVLVVFVADGAGSARFGGEGANAAVHAAAKFMTTSFETMGLAINAGSAKGLAVRCVEAAREGIRAAMADEIAAAEKSSAARPHRGDVQARTLLQAFQAQPEDSVGVADSVDADSLRVTPAMAVNADPGNAGGVPEAAPEHPSSSSSSGTDNIALRDFACTFLGAISSPQGTVLFQIGDGAVVLDIGQGLELFTAPMTGEYANMTHFVTQRDCIELLQTKFYASPALKLAAFSDGLQRLALNLAQGTPHAPFFAPFFSVLARATSEQEESLQAQLAAFLDSDPVNERTDDDKSLALAVLCAS